LIQVDGEEDIKAGPDLWEMAELVQHLGLSSVVNIDGGGSSTTVFHDKVVDRPTCDDTPTVCERRVTSITCIY
jgi:exopolysaccharide biosynthesis protein